MKKIFRLILIVVSVVTVLSFGSVNTSEAAVINSHVSENADGGITVIRTVENGITYINIYLNDSILVMKVEEL